MTDAKKTLKSFYVMVRPSLIAVAIGLLIGLIVLFIFNPMQAIPAMFTLLMGGFNGGIRGIGNMLYYATPIILTGLAVAFAFKTGLFNIGASGQMMLGAYVSIHVGVLWDLPGALHWFVAIFLGMLAGGLWALIPGLLKVISNVNEVVASIMMNYIAGHLVIIMIKNNVYNVLQARSMNVKPSAQLPLLSTLFPGSTVNIGIIIAILIAIGTHILIHKTTLGFQLRASGFSMDGSKYAGMNTKANVVIAMTYSGMLAGLAGALSYLVIGKTMPTAFAIFSEGFDGISVALLGLGEPIGALFAGLFLSHLRSGGFYMQLYDFVPEIIDIIIAVIIYVTAISAAIQLFFDRKRKAKREAIAKAKHLEGGDV
ncbi:MAG: ABC transporter permease [Acholeplasmataceae bacterium]|nr:ABC transporter permease [Acholeplasmataceae bacterium]